MKTRILFLGTILSLLVAFATSGQPGSANFTAIRLINAGDGSTVPSINGSIFYNQSTNKFRAYEGGAWKDLIGGGSAAFSLGSLNGSTKSADGGAYTSGTFYLQTADETYPGLVSTGAQTFAGSKTFTGNAAFNGWVTLNSRVPIGVNSFFVANATNGFRVHDSNNGIVLARILDTGSLSVYGSLIARNSSNTETINLSPNGSSYILGNLGLGTTTPNAPLQFAASTARRKIVLREYFNNDHQVIGFGAVGGDLTYQVSDFGSSNHIWYAGTSSTTSNELMRLTGTGILKIGGGSGDGVTPIHVFRGNVYGTIAQFEGGTTSYSTFIEHTSSATVIKNNLARHITLAPNGVHHFVFNHTGDFTAAGVGTATDWVATSDRRLKENVKPVVSQLEKVEAIAELVRNYDRKDNGKNETGFIAQELAEVAPEYVNVPEADSVMWSVNYSKMVVPLYAAIAELKAEIEELKAENQKLKSKRRRK